jgi:hypothetical protein
MSAAARPSQSPIKLPPAWAIGFTGHRNLPDENKSRAAIRKTLEEWKTRIPGVAYGVSSVAAGGDLLFAETCLALKLPLRIFLPMPRERFREDFDDPTWARVELILAQALSVEVTGASEQPPERYYECGIETVQQSRLLIALWDGGPSQGLGGTGDMVRFAEEQGREVIWIHSATGEVRTLNEKSDLLRDPELDFLNGLEEPAGELSASTPHDLARAWLAKVDETAGRVAPQFRLLAAIPIFCTAGAALLSGRSTFGGSSVVWLWIGTSLGLLAAGLPFAVRLNRRQSDWLRTRTAAEICRSCLALWKTPELYDAVGPETVPELAGVLASLNFLNLSDVASRKSTLEEFKRCYREERVQHQIAYFDRHASKASDKVRKYKILAWASNSLGLALNFWILMNAHGLNHWIQPRWKPPLSFAVTTFFQVATVAGALLFVYDYQRRRERYRNLHGMLAQWDKQLELAQTWPVVLKITSLAEKALLAELIEWRSLIRHRKVPAK